MEKHTFILSDESLNRYGFRVLTSGIILDDFKNNPVMLYNHQRSSAYGNAEILPIGKWNDPRKKDGQLLAEPEFDMDDDFAKKISSKVDKKILNATSIGFEVIEISEDPKYLLPGQTRPTVTKCRLTEASITDIPANRNSLKLTDASGNVVELSTKTNPDDLEKFLPQIKTPTIMKKDVIATKLSLAPESTEEEVLAKVDSIVTELSAKSTEVTQLQKEKQDLETKLAAAEAAGKKEKALSLVENALSAGKIMPGEKDKYLKLAEGDYDTVKEILDAKKPHASITQQLSAGVAAQDDARKDWTFDDYSKKDPESLLSMKTDTPDRYIALFKAKYGKEPNL